MNEEHEKGPTMRELHARAKREDPAAIASALCRRFPDLRFAPGVDPWDAEKLDEWAASDMGEASISNVRFILAIWSGPGTVPWKVGKFELCDINGFDQHGVKVFQEWAADPFFL